MRVRIFSGHSKLFTAVLGLFSVSMVEAVQFRDYDKLPTVSGGQPYFLVSGDFNIAAGDGGIGDVWGYSSVNHTITGATLNFGVTFQGQSSKYSVDVADLGFLNSLDFSSAIPINYSYNIADNIFSLSSPLVADLKQDGALPYKVYQFPGYFTVDYAELLVTASVKSGSPQGVPETASSMALLAGAMATISVWRRARKA